MIITRNRMTTTTILAAMSLQLAAIATGAEHGLRPRRGLKPNQERREMHEICHKTMGGDQGEKFILVKSIPNPALGNHLNHGDGTPGGDVPGRPGCQFTAMCEVDCVQQLTVPDPIRQTMAGTQVQVANINLFDYVLNAKGPLEVIEVNGNLDDVGANVTLVDGFYKTIPTADPDVFASEFLITFCEGGDDSGREYTPDAWFNIESDGIASFTQLDNTGVDSGPNFDGSDILSGYVKSDLSFAYLGGDETVEVYATFVVRDTVTGQTAQGELIIDVVGENDSPNSLTRSAPWAEKFVNKHGTVGFSNILDRFTDIECNFPLAYGTIYNGGSTIINPVLPLAVAGDNGGIYHFLVDGQVNFEQTGIYNEGQVSSISISIVDSEGAEGPLFPLKTTQGVPPPNPGDGPGR